MGGVQRELVYEAGAVETQVRPLVHAGHLVRVVRAVSGARPRL